MRENRSLGFRTKTGVYTRIRKQNLEILDINSENGCTDQCLCFCLCQNLVFSRLTLSMHLFNTISSVVMVRGYSH